MAALWHLNRTQPTNVRVFASVDMACGAKIHEEKPLLDIEVGLSKNYNPDNFFLASGAGLDRWRQNLSARERAVLNALHNGGSTAAQVCRSNCYNHEYNKNGRFHMTICVYIDLSRVNHSCRPNAVVEWNQNIRTGVLHALEDIAAGTEICVEYMAAEADALRGAIQRQVDYQTLWAFQCTYGACTAHTTADDRARKQALRAHRMLTANKNRRDEEDHDKVDRMIDSIDSYITTLKDLGIKDSKLVSAFLLLADRYEDVFHYAHRHNVENGDASHCERCTASGSARPHLIQIYDPLHAAFQHRVRCSGAKHPETKALGERKDAVWRDGGVILGLSV